MINGVKEVIEFLKERKIFFLFFMNNFMRDFVMYREKFFLMGIDVLEDVIVMLGLVMRFYMEKYFELGEVFVIGGKGFFREMECFGWGVVSFEDVRKGVWKRIKYVVVGFDFELIYEKFKYGMFVIRNGVSFIGMNLDMIYLVEEGFYFGVGVIIVVFRVLMDRELVIIGKLNELVYEVVKDKFGDVEEFWMVGDRFDIDIVFVKCFGMKVIMVFMGVSMFKDVVESGIKLNFVFFDVGELKRYLEVVF